MSLFYYLLFCAIVPLCKSGHHERRLHKALLEDYNPLTRPVANEKEPVKVGLGISLQQVIDVDEKNQLINTNIWLNFRWIDEHLVWNPANYGGIQEIRMSPDKLWIPDILLYNSVDVNFNSVYQANVIIHSNGTVEWIPPGIVKSTCKIDITWFPFDDQKCILKFGSWTYGGQFLVLFVGQISTEEYTKNGEWELVELLSNLNKNYYDCCIDPYYDIIFTIWLRRRTLYYGFNLIIPCLLIALMALLDFVLPPEAGEKLTLGITIFMSLCVFLLMVADLQPPTSDAVPLIGVYFSVIMIIVSTSQVFTVMVLNFHHRDADMHEMPQAIRLLFLEWLPKLLLMQKPAYLRQRKNTVKENRNYEWYNAEPRAYKLLRTEESDSALSRKLPMCPKHNPPKASPSLLSNISGVSFNNDDDQLGRIQAFNVRMQELQQGNVSDDIKGSSLLFSVELLLHGILKELKVVTKKVHDDTEEEETERDWRFAAIVLDRLCMVLFVTVFSIATCAIIFAAPAFSGRPAYNHTNPES